MNTVAFIGCGNMGSALARAACPSVGPENVYLANRTLAKAQALGDALGCHVAQNNGHALAHAQYVFLCVKPHLLSGVLAELASDLEGCAARGEEKVLISVAAGVTLDTLRSFLPAKAQDIPLLRLMPNTCVEIGQGMSALCAAPNTPRRHTQAVQDILSHSGRVDLLEEPLMDAFTSVAGCGPAYVYPFLEALADGGVMVGLPRRQAMEYAAQTLLGAAAMVLESGQHPGALKDAVCSPGGSTIAGVAALEANGLRHAAIQAVLAAYEKNKQLGKQ